MSRSKELFNEIRTNLAVLENESEEGNISEMQLYADLAFLEKDIKSVKERISETALLEFERYGQKSVELDGYTFSKSASGRYSYKHAPEWQALTAMVSDVQKKMQMAFKSGTGQYIDPDTGEVYTAAEYNPNKESLSIKIKK